MKKTLVPFWLVLFLCGCGEHEVKRMIIEPHPPAPMVSGTSCHLHLANDATLKETAIQAAKISEECGFTEEEFKKFTEAELNDVN